MKKVELGQSLETLAHLGVIAGIIFLAVEINQNTGMIEAQMNQSRTDSALSEAQALWNSDYIPDILVKMRKDEPLTDVQLERISHWFRSFNRNMDNQLGLYYRGVLGDDVLRSVRFATLEIISISPAILVPLWEHSEGAYSDEYIRIVAEVVSGLE